MQAFIPMIPWLYLLSCSVHFGCKLPLEQNWHRFEIKSLTPAALKFSSKSEKNLSFFWKKKNMQKKVSFLLKYKWWNLSFLMRIQRTKTCRNYRLKICIFDRNSECYEFITCQYVTQQYWELCG